VPYRTMIGRDERACFDRLLGSCLNPIMNPGDDFDERADRGRHVEPEFLGDRPKLGDDRRRQGSNARDRDEIPTKHAEDGLDIG